MTVQHVHWHGTNPLGTLLLLLLYNIWLGRYISVRVGTVVPFLLWASSSSILTSLWLFLFTCRTWTYSWSASTRCSTR